MVTNATPLSGEWFPGEVADEISAKVDDAAGENGIGEGGEMAGSDSIISSVSSEKRLIV